MRQFLNLHLLQTRERIGLVREAAEHLCDGRLTVRQLHECIGPRQHAGHIGDLSRGQRHVVLFQPGHFSQLVADLLHPFRVALSTAGHLLELLLRVADACVLRGQRGPEGLLHVEHDRGLKQLAQFAVILLQVFRKFGRFLRESLFVGFGRDR